MPEERARAETARSSPLRPGSGPAGQPGGSSPAGSIRDRLRARRMDAARRAVVERRMGSLLRQMRDGGLHQRLGFVRLGDYAGERLGLGTRTAQELMRTDAALEDLPRTAAAFTAGTITSGHVRILSRVAVERTEAWWLRVAARLPVRQLAAAVEREVRSRDGAEDAVPPSPVSPEDLAEKILEGHRLIRDDTRAPAYIASLWRETVCHMGWLLGHRLPGGACLDNLLAEASGGMLLGSGSSPPTAPVPEPGSEEPDPAAPSERPLRRRRVICTMPDAPSGEAPAGGQAAKASSPPPDARDLDRRLRELVAERQRHELALGRRLREAASSRSFRAESFSTLEAWALETLGLSSRRVYYLLALERTLGSLPGLRRAFLSGRVTLRKALLVGSVAKRATEPAWIQRAAAVTLRRLEDEVTYWKLLRETRPHIWRALRGRPLPADIVLVPGHPPRLHGSAPSDPSRASGGSRFWPAGDGLHGSAPPRAGAGAGSGAGEGGTFDPAIGASGPGDDPRRGSASCASHEPPDLTGREFLALLQADEAADPLPERMCRITVRLEPEVLAEWRRHCARGRHPDGRPLEKWETLALLLRDYWRTWDNEETRARRRSHPILERDGWRCMVPGCSSTGHGQLQTHHVEFRSAGGALADPANQVAECNAHHLFMLHGGLIRCRGEAPDGLTWELGTAGRGEEPFLRYRGEVRVGGTGL